MSRPFRAATIAALSFCALLASYSVPSRADERVVQPIQLASLTTTNPYALRAPAVLTTQDAVLNPTTTSPFPGSAIVQPLPATPAPEAAATLTALVDRNEATETADRDQQCLAGAVYFEAKSESVEGQLAVAEVIKNRAGSGRFPASYCGVVFQQSQFSFVRGGDLPPIKTESPAWRRAVAVARIATENLWHAVAPKALFFHASRVSPSWHNLTRVSQIGNHVFYR